MKRSGNELERPGMAKHQRIEPAPIQSPAFPLELYPDELIKELLGSMSMEPLFSFSLTSKRFRQFVPEYLVECFSYRDELNGKVRFNFSSLFSLMQGIVDKTSAPYSMLKKVFIKMWPSSEVDVYQASLQKYLCDIFIFVEDRPSRKSLGNRWFCHVPGYPEVTLLFAQERIRKFVTVTEELIVDCAGFSVVQEWILDRLKRKMASFDNAEWIHLLTSGRAELLMPFAKILPQAALALSMALYSSELGSDPLSGIQGNSKATKTVLKATICYLMNQTSITLNPTHKTVLTKVLELELLAATPFFASPSSKFIVSHIFGLEYKTELDAVASEVLEQAMKGEQKDAPNDVLIRALELGLVKYIPDSALLRLLYHENFVSSDSLVMSAVYFQRSPAVLSPLLKSLPSPFSLRFFSSVPKLILSKLSSTQVLQLVPHMADVVQSLLLVYYERRNDLVEIISAMRLSLDDYFQLASYGMFPGVLQHLWDLLFMELFGMNQSQVPATAEGMSLVSTLTYHTAEMPAVILHSIIGRYSKARASPLDRYLLSILIRALVLKGSDVSVFYAPFIEAFNEIAKKDGRSPLGRQLCRQLSTLDILPSEQLASMLFSPRDQSISMKMLMTSLRFAVSGLNKNEARSLEILRAVCVLYSENQADFTYDINLHYFNLHDLDSIKCVRLYHALMVIPESTSNVLIVLLHVIRSKPGCLDSLRASLTSPESLTELYKRYLDLILESDQIWMDLERLEKGLQEDQDVPLNLTEDFPLAGFFEDLTAGRMEMTLWEDCLSRPQYEEFARLLLRIFEGFSVPDPLISV